MKKIQIATVLLASIISIPGIASATTVETRIEDRIQELDRRIGKGIAEGTVDRTEYQDLERRSDSVVVTYNRYKSSGGGLTPAEVLKLDQKLDRLAFNIYQARQ